MLPPVTDVVLEVLAPIAEVGLVLLGIVDFDDGVEDVLLLPFGGLAEDLFRGDLDGCRGAVFHPALVLG